MKKMSIKYKGNKFSYRIFLMITVLILSAFISGCGSNTDEAHGDEKKFYGTTPGGDIREETASIQELPAFLQEKSDEMQAIYVGSAQHQDLLEHIPCYCGCGNSVGHKSNYECFVHENREDGSLVWDDHGTKCGVCLEIAATSIIEYQNGKTPSEIREMIDEKYKEGYAEPTPTPLPGA